MSESEKQAGAGRGEGASAGRELERLLEVMRRLREGCPWDRGQDLRSLRPYLVEEAYEVLDAMDAGDLPALREELGDLLFQIVFQSKIAEESGAFGMAEVVAGVAGKLERRHPHVFAGLTGVDAETALRNWAALKREERRRAGAPSPSALDGVPKQEPGLRRAERLSEKAARGGFDWSEIAGVRAKVDEELRELDEAVAGGAPRRVEEELGDVLFALCNLARWLKAPAEDALRGAIERFERRFREVERRLEAEGRTTLTAGSERLDELWNAVKADEGAG